MLLLFINIRGQNKFSFPCPELHRRHKTNLTRLHHHVQPALHTLLEIFKFIVTLIKRDSDAYYENPFPIVLKLNQIEMLKICATNF